MSVRTKVLVMAGTLLGLFTAAMDQTIVGTSMPKIIGDLGGFNLFSWVGTGFMLASTAAVPIVGKLTDIFGRKPFYMAGIFVLLLGSALCGSAQNVEQLIAFRVIQGLGAGMIMGIAFAIVGDVFPPAERGKWAGLMSGVFASASVLGPLIGGTLTDHASWRWAFYVNIPMGGAALAVLFFGMPHIRPVSGGSTLDYRGIVLLLAAVLPALVAFSWAGSRYDWLSFPIVGLLSWALAALVVFAYAELRAADPLLPMTLFRNRIFTVSGLVTLISGFAMMGSLFYIPLFVQGVLGASATNSGFVTMPMMISMAIASAIAGQIMSRFGHYRLLGVTGLLIMAGGMYLLSGMTVNSTPADATLAMIVFGLGLGTSMPLFMLAVQNAVEYRFMGIATSTMQFLRMVGGTMGVAVMFSFILSTYHGRLRESAPALVQAEPQLFRALDDPQFLLNEPAYEQVRAAFAGFGAQGQKLLDQTLLAVRTSLADGIADAFFIAVFVLILAVVVGLFMKEIPLRKVHFADGELGALPAEAAVPPAPHPSAPGAAPAPLPQIAGAANGRRLWPPLSAALAVLGLALAVTAAVLLLRPRIPRSP
jgi:EmrB/QacA subfamily drug resistance transporter